MTDRAFCEAAYQLGLLSFTQILDLLLETSGERVASLVQGCHERRLLTAAQFEQLEQHLADQTGVDALTMADPPDRMPDEDQAKPLEQTLTLHWEEGEASNRGVERGESDEVQLAEQAGRYLGQKELGRGGMGIVYCVQDVAMKRRVALKEVLPDLAADESMADYLPDLRRRFVREAELTAVLQHPGIVPVYEIGRRRASGEAYYTMKLVEGRTLAEAIKKAAGLEERLALLPNFIDVCQTLAYAHRHGVIHRDLKPANIIIGEFGETYVLDWGLARRLNPSTEALSESPCKPPLAQAPEQGQVSPDAQPPGKAANLTGHGVGTPYYMSPEQALGQLEEIDTRSDIYSLGAILFEILTGRKIKSYRDVVKLEDILSRGDGSPDGADLALSLPDELIAICKRAMALKKSQRFGDAQTLAFAIQHVQTGAEVVLEQLAEAVHIAYVTERTAQGWRYGPVRDDARKENPTLIPYSELSEEEKELDRVSARQTIHALRKLGYILARERKLFPV
ncbi:protein kinase domain-containing protein [Thiorhodovibrio winogradskyi]|nr:protein kinase [Thiorhodovibrio winogradskyi]